MKKLLFALALAALLNPVAGAQSIFEGTWKIDFSKIDFPNKPDEYLLQNGVYACKTCSDEIPIKADGTDQPSGGFPYADTISVKVVNDRELEITGKKGGRIVGTTKMTVSPDGKTLTEDFWFSPQNGAAPVKGKSEMTRVAAGPPGSHAISGSWRQKKMGFSENAAFFTYKIDNGALTMTNRMGQSFTAKLDGTEAPYKGDPGTTSVQIKLVDPNTLEETDLRDGKVLSVSRMTVDPGGKKAKITAEDKRQNTTSSFEAIKQ